MEDETAPATSTASAPRRAPPPARPPSAPAAGGATVTGKVAFAGTAPAKEPIKMDADAFCKSAHTRARSTRRRSVVNANGTLEWVLVYVKEGVTGKLPGAHDAGHARPARLPVPPARLRDQAGQPLKIVNSDGTLHNIHALPKVNAEFNIGQPFKRMETIKKFDKAEMPVRFKCDVHKWMGAYAGVVQPSRSSRSPTIRAPSRSRTCPRATT